ncbi:DUF2515 family protein [Bacillus suaedaesalsae]|uniref:DUF2515 family protein n=1 Tax=Bacillus suaedaesalsae TaxID=2810349 RepID=A0ABS2DLP4_9BACI|nr:DUF2515 family protein [Bacillus suaedaesalsae]MBM6619388.1 DUF2515 family protein [Bacillus suaedaesalsae]
MWSLNALLNKLPFKTNKVITQRTINDDDYAQLKEILSKTSAATPVSFGQEDRDLVSFIKKETTKYNVNNITRTTAYLEFYKRNKEVHWSFLAHMVSRNGGWNMTDLKGSLIEELLPSNKVQIFFEFLEKANAFIFHDAFPQLMLYEHSKKTGRNLFHLLPYFVVSSFMKPIWELFLHERNSELLTIALILNEQYMIQTRLIDHSRYESEVLHSSLYKAQETFGFTDVLFPFKKRRKIELAGETVRGFNNVKNRINIGKSLYGILFHRVYQQAFDYAISTPHTGSRVDYWPHLFLNQETTGSNKIYSPSLTDVWPDVIHTYKTEDWFTKIEVIEQIKSYQIPSYYMKSENYKSDLKKLLSIQSVKDKLSK